MSTQPRAQPSAYRGPSAVLNDTDLAVAHVVHLPHGTYVLVDESYDTRVFVRNAARPYTSRSPVRITLHDGLTFEYEDAGMGTMEMRMRC